MLYHHFDFLDFFHIHMDLFLVLDLLAQSMMKLIQYLKFGIFEKLRLF